MYILLLIVHVVVCLVLVLVVLLQAGRGGGMSDMFGGGQPSSLFGTQTNVFLTRATEACAVLFVFTSIGLGYLTTQHSKSLMDRVHAAPSSLAAKTVELPKPVEAAKDQQMPATVPAPVTAAAPAPVAAPAAAPATASATQAPAEKPAA